MKPPTHQPKHPLGAGGHAPAPKHRLHKPVNPSKVKPKRSKPMNAKQYKAYLHWLKTHPRKKTPHHPVTANLQRDHNMPVPGKLGRKQPYPKWAAPRLEVHDFIEFEALPAPPAVIDYASKVASWPMYLNDQLGDCTAACVGHELEAWTAYASSEFSLTDDDVLGLYEQTSGYVPGDPSTDNGAVIQDVLDYWRANGVAGHRIVAFAELTKWDATTLRQALEIFGTVYLGINCPQSALDQFSSGQPWTLVPGSPSAGGHAIPLQAWDSKSLTPATVITWGHAQLADDAFLQQYVEEAWVIITQDWLDAQAVTPVEGFNFHQLSEDFTLLTGQPGPLPPGPVPPGPPAPPPSPPNPGCFGRLAGLIWRARIWFALRFGF